MTSVREYVRDILTPQQQESLEASVDSAKLFRKGDADGPAIAPIYEPARPVIDDVFDPKQFMAELAVLLQPPVPTKTVVVNAVRKPGSACDPVQIVPPAGGIPRQIRMRSQDIPEACYLYSEYMSPTLATDREAGFDTAPPGGYLLPANQVFETTTQGPIYIAFAGVANNSKANFSVTAWIDYYGKPTDALR